jgi:hypothetical protein
MRQLSLILAVALSSVVWDVPSAGADTRAPSAQIFVLECGGASVTFVSPKSLLKNPSFQGSTDR